MSLAYEVRYFLEHKALPRALYHSREHLMASLLGRRNRAMMDFYAKAERSNPDYTCPYTSEQFSLIYREYIEHSHTVFIIRLGMPKPERSPLCRGVYLCFADDRCEDAYFTSELSPAGKYLLCAWTADEAHLNYGETTDDEFATVAKLFSERI